MRVLHLPIVICNQPWELSRALRRIGIWSDYMVLDDTNAGWLIPGTPDYNLNIYHRPVEHDRNKRNKIRKDIQKFLIYSLFKYDVFHYHSNHPLLEDYSDLKILKLFRKKIVVSYWGCDIRLKSVNQKFKFSTCGPCKISCDEEKVKKQMSEFSKYANIKLVSMPELLVYSPDAQYLPAVVDTKFWKPDKYYFRQSKTFKIFHSFGNSVERGDVKGSNSIIKAVDRLKDEGNQIELLFFDKVPNVELKKHYQECDLVIEQLLAGWHGVTALEAMSLGIPVISYIRKDLIKYDPELPIINANPDTIYDVLKWAINNRQKLLEIGIKSREYTIKNRDSLVIAKKLYQIYKSLY